MITSIRPTILIFAIILSLIAAAGLRTVNAVRLEKAGAQANPWAAGSHSDLLFGPPPLLLLLKQDVQRPSSGACPANLTVNDLGDAGDSLPGNSVCLTSGGVCTLRAAIEEANALTGCSGTLPIIIAVNGEIDLTAALAPIAHNIAVTGPGAEFLTVHRSSGGNYGIWHINAGITASLSGVTLTNGLADFGGGVRNDGTLTLTEVAITGNQAVGGPGEHGFDTGNRAAGGTGGGAGGGVYNAGTLTILRSTISGNSGTGGAGGRGSGRPSGGGGAGLGGGLYSDAGSVAITNSTIANNTVTGGNGGSNDFGGGMSDTGGDAGQGPGGGGGGGSNQSGGARNGGVGGFGAGGGAGGLIPGSLGGDGGYGAGGGGGDPIGGVGGFGGGHGANDGTGGGGGAGLGGGVFIRNGTLSLTNSTIFGNQTVGGIANFQPVVPCSGCTDGTGVGGGLFNFQGTANVLNTIVAGNNGSSSKDVFGAFNSQGTNVIGSLTGATGFINGVNGDAAGSDAAVIDPHLLPLAANGGHTQTLLPLHNSVAVDHGNIIGAPANDQRGNGRPFPAGGNVDIGSVELQTSCAAIILSPSFLPTATQNQPYQVIFGATGGTGTVTFSLGGGSLPPGFTLNPNGTFSGTPPTTGSSPFFRITATDSTGCSGFTNYQLNVVPGCPTTLTVNDLGDADDSSPGNGVCATAGGVCTLRAAIEEVNADNCGGTTTINFSVAGTIAPATELPGPAKAMVINGPGAGNLTIEANHQFRGFNVTANAPVTISNLTIADGQAPAPGGPDPFLAGGGVLFRAVGGTIDHCVIRGGSAIAGGAIAAGTSGTTSILNSTLSTNNAGAGGALYQGSPADVVITNSTFNDNSSTAGQGGAFHDSSSGAHNITIINSTFSHNTAQNNSVGGAIYAVSGTMSILNSTFTLNSAGMSGGAVYQGGPTQIKNSIFAQNTAGFSGRDLFGSFTSAGNNLIGSNDANGFTAGQPNTNNDYVGTNAAPLNAGLAPLGNYGGPTPTHALLCSSLALDHGNNAGAPATDQRGVIRPKGPTVDIGSFEANITLSIAPLSPPSARPGTPYTANLNASGGLGSYSFVLTGGSLPGGLTLAANGQISGTPAGPGAFTFTVLATDASGAQGCAALSLTVVIPAPLDFDGDGITDYAVVRDGSLPKPAPLLPGAQPPWVGGGVLDEPGTEGDGTTERMRRGRFFKLPGERFDPSTPRVERPGGLISPLRWIIHTSGPTADINLLFGSLDDFPVPADYDGDGKTDIAVWTGGVNAQFQVLTSSSNFTVQVNYTLGNDLCDPSVAGDYDGDGRADPAVFNVNTGQWQYLGGPAHATLVTVTPVGTVGGVIPIPGDFDGDGKYDFMMETRDGLNPTAGHFYLWSNTGGTTPVAATNFVFGNYRDVVVPGDYDGDGITDLGLASVIVNPIAWRIRLSPSGNMIGPVNFGNATIDYTVTGDYDGNRKGEFTIWHSPGLFQSLLGPAYVTPTTDFTWGESGDYPVAYFNSH